MRLVSLFLTIFVFIVPVLSTDGLLRFPDVYNNQVVFVCQEDIWIAPTEGGTAMRLTMNDGEEHYPKFSPDGSLIAFSGEYDGNEDVYVMNIDGSNITRVTWHPGNDIVVGWHPLKNKIIFTSNRSSYSRFNRLFMIAPDGTGLEEMILCEAVQGSFSPDGKQIAYNKVSRENRTWKRYRGGTAQEIYVYNLETNEEINISNFRGTDRIPMWIGNKIYFSSDRDRVLNIYSYDTQTKQIEQITNHTAYDIRRPSYGGNQIVYELGGDLYLLDVNSKSTHKLDITIPGDAPELRPYLKDVKDDVTGISISPSGKRALIEARGEIFSVPNKDGATRNLTNSSGAHDKDAVWSPNGKQIAWFSDANGEYNLYLSDPMGKSVKKITDFKDGYRHTLRWSPDSKKIAFTDQTLTLNIIDIQTGKITKADKAEYENIDVSIDVKPIYDFAWSPDSRYIAYSKMDETFVNKLYIFDLNKNKVHGISNGLFNDFHPVFSTDGEHLFFISNRRFEPTYGDFEWEMVYKDVAGIYAMTLRKDGPSILPFKSDEENGKTIDSEKIPAKKDIKVIIDFDGIAERVEALPLKNSNYRNLAINEKSLFYLNKEKGDFNRFEFRNIGSRDLMAYSFEDRSEKTVIKSIDDYVLSADGSSIIYRQGKDVGIIASNERDSKGEKISLTDLKMDYDPMAEWQQIFNESWRMERDFYYEPNMHGIDWPAMKIKYGKLLDKATCRQDIRFIVGELIGELNTSHTYVYGGDQKRKAESVNIGLLGADFELDAKSNLYRFKKVYKTNNWIRNNPAPLAAPGREVHDGEYLLKVNGQEVKGKRNVYSYFVDLADKQVVLTVSSKSNGSDARDITVEPIRYEGSLRYIDWIENNRKIVEETSNGEIGYLHFPDTYNGSAAYFPLYYAQTQKKGLIIDARFNAGGLDPDIFLSRLAKSHMSYWTRRYSHDQFNPWLSSNAHMVCITNRQAGSGGDEFPFEFRQKKMGPVIGTRSWGGLVGVSMFIRMIDGGGLTAPDYRIYNTKGKWVVENEGVTPDEIIDIKSDEIARGYDAQLMRAVEILKENIKNDPFVWPKHEPFPIDK
ncbi:MAG: PDZ domain-containing protein [Calditrichaceae bacterium]